MVVLGTDSELDVGGFAWDARLAGHLAQVFGSDPSSLPPRALSKLLKEAQLVQFILIIFNEYLNNLGLQLIFTFIIYFINSH